MVLPVKGTAQHTNSCGLHANAAKYSVFILPDMHYNYCLYCGVLIDLLIPDDHDHDRLRCSIIVLSKPNCLGVLAVL